MKKLLSLLPLLTLLICVGCSSSSEEEITPVLELSKESITISPDGGSASVTVLCNNDWTLTHYSDWCTPSVTSGSANANGQTVTFTADMSYDMRSAIFTFRSNGLTKELTVKQDLKAALIVNEEESVKNVPGYESTISFQYDASVSCKFQIPDDAKDWISTTEPTKSLSTIYQKLYSSANPTGKERSAVVKLQAVDYEDIFFEFTIIQSPRNCIEYTTTDGNAITINEAKFSSKIVNHNYSEDCGYIDFETPITVIDNEVFQDCETLASIKIPEGVTSIGNSAFKNCKNLASIDIPKGVTTIENYTFQGCKNLVRINIPESVISIGIQAFEGCANLKDVYIYDLSKWCELDFNHASSNPLNNGANLWCNDELVTNLPEGITHLGQFQFIGCASFTKLTTPPSLTTICKSALSGCKNLEEIKCSEGLTTIEESAFTGSNNLTTVHLPKSTTSIGKAAFNSCI